MMNEFKRGVYTNTNTDEVYEFGYKTDLTVSEKVYFVNNVMAFVVGEYFYPMVREMIVDYAIIQYFTDVEFNEDLNFDQIEQILAETNIVDIVKMNMKDGLLDELNRMIDVNIEYKTGIRMNRVDTMVEKLLDVIRAKVEEIDVQKVASLAEQLNGVKDELTPDRIVEAYMNSELNQKRMKDASSEKKLQVVK